MTNYKGTPKIGISLDQSERQENLLSLELLTECKLIEAPLLDVANLELELEIFKQIHATDKGMYLGKKHIVTANGCLNAYKMNLNSKNRESRVEQFAKAIEKAAESSEFSRSVMYTTPDKREGRLMDLTYDDIRDLADYEMRRFNR